MNKALFLDRDGVINVDHEYVHEIDAFEFMEGIFDLCHRAQEAGYLIIVVTNQSGIARGRYSTEQFRHLSQWMVAKFQGQGIEITEVYHCPHHPDITGSCHCRKPEPGMLLDAAKAHQIDLSCSILVGDRERDIEAAVRAGVPKRYLLDPQHHGGPTAATAVVQRLEEIPC